MVGPVTGTPIPSSLLFCLFSFLFGVGLSVLHAVLRGVLSAFFLLPPVERRASAGDRHAKEPSSAPAEKSDDAAKGARDENKKKGTRRFVLGYLLLDLSFFLLATALYLLFLFLLHGGVLRIYSLLLLALGMLVSYPTARALVARPVFVLLSLPGRLLGWALSPFFRRILRWKPRKKPKQLDETDKMV